jgi:hypothetical protein
MKILLKTLNHITTDLFSHFGVSLLKNPEESTSLPFAGILDIKIYLQWDMVHMIS